MAVSVGTSSLLGRNLRSRPSAWIAPLSMMSDIDRQTSTCVWCTSMCPLSFFFFLFLFLPSAYTVAFACRLWEGSWASDALSPDPENDSYTDPSKVRQINHKGKYFTLNSRHIVDPSPQRTPFLFQAGTSAAGSSFAATHAEAIFVSSHSPKVLRPRVRQPSIDPFFFFF